MKYQNELFYIAFVVVSFLGSVVIVSLSKLRETLKDECEIMQAYLRQICVNTSEKVKKEDQVLKPMPGNGSKGFSSVPPKPSVDMNRNLWIP